MPRVRKFRYALLLAVFVLVLLYRVTRDGDSFKAITNPLSHAPLEGVQPEAVPAVQPVKAKPPPYEDSPNNNQAPIQALEPPTAKATTRIDDVVIADFPAMTIVAPVIDIPDRKTPQDDWKHQGQNDDGYLHIQSPPGGRDGKTPDTTTTIHWSKQREHFPVSSDQIIPLPTGKPKSIPKIQHVFKQESTKARTKREQRLAKVKAEAVRAWSGYREYAWMHDELSPISKTFRDPFCGWAATLVDTLDTLWIMGMEEDFDEAVKAVKNIDFTYSAQRDEIPVFETTIRYLGGLLSAYDVSGQAEQYKILLYKAIDLAEILMGVFDTPNRMPVLYYNWKPAFASQPKLAGTAISIAEMGSLTMEFTRLAQITKENKYYDAVARITDALDDWQTRGTSIPGIFPERVDASGCNRTAANEAALRLTSESTGKDKSPLGPPEGYTGREYSSKPNKEDTTSRTMSKDPEFVVVPSDKEDKPAKGKFRQHEMVRRSDIVEDDHDALLLATKLSPHEDVKVTKPKLSSLPDVYHKMINNGETAQPFNMDELGAELCYPQGLSSASWGMESYSMGGSQDSTYEYFPKEFLLLGGLEPKYKKMHLEVAEAVKKWLLYRPMLPDNRDILFSASVMTNGKPEQDLVSLFEVTHLTCFLGGMFGMAGKIFEDAVDLEIGKKLTDGCVWAYESMPSGVMAEGASVVPCQTVNDCHWNETVWRRFLDPLWETRDLQIDDYYRRQEEFKKQNAENAKQEELRRAAESQADSDVAGDKTRKLPLVDDSTMGRQGERAAKAKNERAAGKPNLTRRREGAENSSIDGLEDTKIEKHQEAGGMKVTIGHIGAPVEGGAGQAPLTETNEVSKMPDPARPLSHQEYVQDRIENERLPPGYVSVSDRRYILRPEAIESVWYMYRITGDTKWQDKGWKMFEAIIQQTQTEAGHSAVNDVLMPNSDKVNEMESFWLAETLKYFYLLYSEPDVISLDEWVLNTEAHPFKRPT